MKHCNTYVQIERERYVEIKFILKVSPTPLDDMINLILNREFLHCSRHDILLCGEFIQNTIILFHASSFCFTANAQRNRKAVRTSTLATMLELEWSVE